MDTTLCIYLFLCYGILLEAQEIKVARRIQALADDVPVKVRNADVGQVVELFYDGRPVTAQVVTKESETLIFNCGYFFETGSYFFKIRTADGQYLSSSREVNARGYPRIFLRWPSAEHRALSTDVKVSIEGSMCDSDIARQNRMFLKLSEGDTFTMVDTLVPPYYVIPCEAFQSAGEYKIALAMTSPQGRDVTLSESESLLVEWSRDYDLRLSAFPCKGTGLSVISTAPACAQLSDQIRVIAVFNGTMEQIASKRRVSDHVTFPCVAFDNSSAAGYCFQYVTTSGFVASTMCQPIKPGFNMAGSWSPWTEWRTCERGCRAAVERRKRICDNPAPKGDGKLCIDQQGDEKLEEMEIVYGTKPDECSQYSEECGCGCTILLVDFGQIASSLRNDCGETRTLIWIVKASRSIKFTLKDFQLAPDEVLTIRDADTSHVLTSTFHTITTRRNISLVQLVKSADDLNSCGFILDLESVETPYTPSTATTTSAFAENKIMTWVVDNPVVFGGIAVCALVIVLVAVLVCRKRKKRKMPPGTPMNTRLALPPDGRSCSNADETESEPMVRPHPVGNSDKAEPIQVGPSTAYYLAQRQLEIMKRLGKEEHAQNYATECLKDEVIRQQEELMFGDRKSVTNNEDT